jgi:hypothetical protein
MNPAAPVTIIIAQAYRYDEFLSILNVRKLKEGQVLPPFLKMLDSRGVFVDNAL